MTGSTPDRRLISRLILGVMRRFLTGDKDAELVIGWGIVAAISFVGDDALHRVADERFHLGDDNRQRWPS